MDHLKKSISERILYFNVNSSLFSLISSLEKVAAEREKRREKNDKRKEQKEKATLRATFSFWWGMVDSNHRRRCQQIYSLSPLATREIPHMKLELVDGFEPPTC